VLRPAVTALTAAAVLLLTGCGGEDRPPRVKTGPEPACETQGTVASVASSTMRAAVAPYLRDGERFRLEKEVTDTATVLLERRGGGIAGRVTLVKVEGGWAPTTVERCR
jgi:hypothetical protein